MVFIEFKFSFAKVGLEYFPIIWRCWISSIKFGIYLVEIEWFKKYMNFYLQRMVLDWGIFPSFVDVGYHL
jgi:hypothetical protein